MQNFAVASDDVISTTIIFGQRVNTKIPENWYPVHENANAGTYILEFIPKGQTLDNWKEMFTIQGFEGAASKISPKDFLARLGNALQTVCNDKLFLDVFDSTEVDSYQSSGAVVKCTSMKTENLPEYFKNGGGEIDYFIAVEGKEDLYTFHYAKRLSDTDIDAQLTKDHWKKAIEPFMPIHLCSKESKFNECLK